MQCYQRDFHSIRRGDEHGHGEAKVWRVLLEFDVLVSRQEYIELLGSESKEKPVSLAGPPHLPDGPDLVIRDQSG